MLEIKCPSCGAAIPPENIDLDKHMATCNHCGAVAMIANTGSRPDSDDRPAPLPMGMPGNFSVDDDGLRLRIERRWFHWSGVIILVFALFWNGLIWGMFMPNFGRIRFGSDGMFGQFFMLPFVLVGIGMAIHGISSLINRTILTVDNGELLIQHRPLPYPGKRLSAYDIQQLYAKQRVSRNYNSSTHSSSTSVTYELRALLQDGSDKKLLGGLNGSEQAQYIEQEVERFLRIKDRAVRGEYR